MNTETTTRAVTVHILDKEYMVSCSEGEQHDLIRSADYLDKKMREVREKGKIIGSDRIAVIAALNISHELLTQGNDKEIIDSKISQRLRSLQEKIEDTLFETQQMEF
ncbi:MAG TPA: cell division protein ZapA [Gammaproteobacteria bacterium]|nr:cell division protein ZapA [Gammaproteobacteria bacterium]